MEESSDRRRSQIVLMVIAAAVVVALVAASVIAALSDDDLLDPATPEGTAQAYLLAVLDGDDATAYGLMTDDLRARCEAEFPRFTPDPARILLESSDVEGDRAVVVVEIDEVSDPLLLDLDGFSYRQRFVMQSVAGEWRISEPPWPYFCPERS